MRISNIGIILLTLLVVTKFLITRNTLSHEDGLLSEKISFDESVFVNEIQNSLHNSNADQLVSHSIVKLRNTEFAGKQLKEKPQRNNSDVNYQEYIFNVTTDNSDDPAPVEYASNTMVVYNPSMPAFTKIYTDPEESEPLDQGNTVILEMQMMMPRR
jgi:hypothetical protein